MSDMSQHNRSLLERAAEAYDFGAALRAPVAPPAPQAAPVEPAPVKVERPVEIRRAPAGTAELDRARLTAAGFIDPEANVTGLAEEFRLIKHQLLADIEQSRQPEERRRAVLIASAQPKSGKTFCAINLALSLAGEKGVEVLLVDGDFPKPDVLATLGLATGPGLVDALADPGLDAESLIIRTDVQGLSVLPAGRKTNNVPELLASGRSREVLAKLIAGDKRRIILFDSPPALMASHATMLAGHVGRTLVVVRADQTTEADLRETIGLLQGCEISLILNGAGLAVTGRKFGAYDGYGHDD
jgi:Mrp family chromosome partitioning ATPase